MIERLAPKDSHRALDSAKHSTPELIALEKYLMTKPDFQFAH